MLQSGPSPALKTQERASALKNLREEHFAKPFPFILTVTLRSPVTPSLLEGGAAAVLLTDGEVKAQGLFKFHL